MRRRVFIFGGAAAAAVASIPDTPRNRLCLAANDFHDQYQQWAERMNTAQKLGAIDSQAAQLWRVLPKRWRKVERLWREWLKV